MNFDALAPHYPWMERWLAGARLQRCRTAWFDQLAGCGHLLVAGVGHGPALAVALQRFPSLRITCVDASAGMLAQAQTQAQRAGADLSRLTFVQATLPDWETAERFDAIATHFFLDCFPPAALAAVIARLAALATPDARWIISDFALPAHGWRRARAQAIHALMYAFFRIVSRLPARQLTPPDPWLRAAGFELGGRRHFEWGLLQADWWGRGKLS